MNKKVIYSVVSASLLCLATFVLGEGIENPIGASDFSTLLTNIATAVGEVIAALGAVMIIVAGILYLTSAGSQDKMATAKKALFYAIIGMAIGLAAGPIVEIVQEIISGP